MKTWSPLVFALLTMLLVKGQRIVSAAGAPPPSPPPQSNDSPELPESSAIRCPTVPEIDEGTLKTLTFSPDGKWIAAGTYNGVVKVFEARTGKRIVSFRPRRDIASYPPIAFAPDGKALAAPNASGQCALFDPTTGRQIRPLDPPDTPFTRGTFQTAIAFSPDGKVLAGSFDNGKVVLWDVASGRRLQTLPPYVFRATNKVHPYYLGKPPEVTVLAFSPDGATLYAAGHILLAWDVAQPAEPRAFDLGSALPCGHLAIAPDGKSVAVAVGFDGPEGGVRSILLVDTASGKRRAEVTTTQAILGLAYLPGGRGLVSLEGYRIVRLREAATAKPIAACRFDAHFELGVLAVSPDGRRIALGGQGSDAIFGVIGLVETDGAKLSPWRPEP